MKIKALQNFWIAGQPFTEGTTTEINNITAKNVISAGLGIEVKPKKKAVAKAKNKMIKSPTKKKTK